MRTMLPVLKRGALYWDKALASSQDVLSRMRSVQAQVNLCGDDVWILYGDVEQYGPVAYATHFVPRTRDAVVILPAQGEPSILAAISSRDVPAAKTLTPIEDLRPYSSAGRAVLEWIDEHGLAAARIGLAGVEERMSFGDWSTIQKGLTEASLSNRTSVLNGLRAQKSIQERAAIRHASSVVSAALDRIPQFLKAGMTVRRLAAEIDRAARMGAAEDVRVLIAAGAQAGVALAPPTDAVIQDGDAVMVFLSAEVQRYWAEMARTFVIGPPRQAISQLAAKADFAFAEMQRIANMGSATGHAVAEAALTALGPVLGRSAASYGFGHGVGFDAEETPRIERGSEDMVVPDSSLALRVILHSEGVGIAIGDMFEASASGLSRLGAGPSVIRV